MNEPLHVRRATTEDAEAWRSLLRERTEWLRERGRLEQWGADGWYDKEEFLAVLDGWIRNDEGRVAVDRSDRVVAALAASQAPAHVEPSAVPELYVKALASSLSGPRGAGRVLVLAVVDEAWSAELAQVRLDCWAGGDGALQAWYRGLGFEVVGRFERDGWPGAVMRIGLEGCASVER